LLCVGWPVELHDVVADALLLCVHVADVVADDVADAEVDVDRVADGVTLSLATVDRERDGDEDAEMLRDFAVETEGVDESEPDELSLTEIELVHDMLWLADAEASPRDGEADREPDHVVEVVVVTVTLRLRTAAEEETEVDPENVSVFDAEREDESVRDDVSDALPTACVRE
jgi:hypothetical protein